MATEKRLIDANKAQTVLVNMAEHLLEAGNPEMAGAVGYAAEVMSKQHTVDAVEVVRCKDCKWRNTKACPYMMFNSFGIITFTRDDFDFCADGERRTNV